MRNSWLRAAAILGALLAGGASAAQGDVAISKLQSGKAHDALFAIAFDQDKGVAVGSAGSIFDSSDAGKTWQRVTPAPTALGLLGVDIKQDKQIAVGQMGLILRRDAQGPWQKAESGTTERLFAVALNSKGVAAAVGSFGTVLKSEDGGQSWKAVAPDWTPYAEDGAQPHLYAVNVDEEGAVTIAGEFGLILRAAAGQSGWQPLHRGDASIFALEFRPDGVGYAVGQSGAALRTADGGRNWTALTTGSEAILLGVRSQANGQIIATGMRDMVASRDDGKTWSHVSGADVASIWYAGVVQPVAGAPMLAVGQGGSIIRIDH